MSEGQNIPPLTSQNSNTPETLEAGAPQGTPPPVTHLAPPPGGGAKPWIIMGVLGLLIAAGLLFIMGADEKEKTTEEGASALEKREKPKRAAPRKVAKTGERPMKKEMVQLSSKNRKDFQANIGKWVRLQGRVRSGNQDGLLEFAEPVKMRGQLAKGSAQHLSGQHVKVIGWLLTEELIQIDGIFDITTMEAVDLLAKKAVYTSADAEQLIALRHTNATFKGKVQKVRVSGSGKNLYLIFEGSGYQFYGSGNLATLGEEGVTEESLKKLIGKTVQVKGKLEYKEMGKNKRIQINFSAKSAFEVLP